MPLRSLYQYVGALTRPVTILLRNRGRVGDGCDADRDATDHVLIHWFPNPPGDDTTQKPVEKKMAVPTDNDAETPAARAQIRIIMNR